MEYEHKHTNDHEKNSLDETLFDRLVDGQLNEEQRRKLLVSLDGEPGGWRRCALAFLEAQCWKEALGRFVTEEASLVDRSEPVRPARRSSWPGRLATLLAMAASFLLALWIGWRVQGNRAVDNGLHGAGEVAQHIPTTAPDAETVDPWKMVTVSAPSRDGKSVAKFTVPAIERKTVDLDKLREPTPIPQEVREALARTGHEVRQRRELVPVPLDDGRQLVMPVDEVKVHYVGYEPD